VYFSISIQLRDENGLKPLANSGGFAPAISSFKSKK